ncbi:thermonuclease family protein [Shewanella sp. MBTL60-007]|uniref:thermonuclease family protein n=1 Tax=Shewanella sp. MBTL60-007 TaxID=2815911 RepID=UPI001BC42359|nr:thermonuclease family protein [Shewanella sp. MBTL60-007]GIU20980.1 nuclease [Shewanella sp. MBTL60-007]
MNEIRKSLIAFAFGLFAATSTVAQDYIVVTSIKSVYDGDTFRAYLPGYAKDQRVRLRGIDTPEIKGQCDSEIRGAIEARDYARQVLESASEVRLYNVGQDRYKRVLADVVVDGESLSRLLINKNLGRKWKGRRENWCS